MKKLCNSLPFRLLLGIAIGIICGLVIPVLPWSGVSDGVMKIIVTLQYIMGQLITFCVPLIIIGFIAPSITKLGANAPGCWAWRSLSPMSPPSAPPSCPWAPATP